MLKNIIFVRINIEGDVMKRKIPTKNYLILFGIVLLVISACFASYNLYNIYQENKIKTSPLAIKEILYEDLKNATKEIDADTIPLFKAVKKEDTNIFKPASRKEYANILNACVVISNSSGSYFTVN